LDQFTVRVKFCVVCRGSGSCDLEHLRHLQERFDVTIIEDCAQSIGAKWKVTSTGTVGKIACTSFYPTKNLGALGDGGALLTNSSELEGLARSLRDYGQSSKYKHDLIGMNSRLDEIHASFLSYAALPHLPEWTSRRKEISEAYLSRIQNRFIKSVGHLCSVTLREAAELGIDDLEHGLNTDTEFVQGKQSDMCPGSAQASLMPLDVQGEQIQSTIRYLVQHHVAITSTLPVFEAGVPNRPPLQQRFLDVLSPPSRTDYLLARARVDETGDKAGTMFKKEEEFEYAFVKAGGLLLAGLDPTGNGAVVAGFGDQREVELLVEAGFTPLEAIHIATENGAKFLGEEDKIGTLKVGKQADLIIIKGDPSKHIEDIEKVETVFKDGKGYDSQRLIDSVQGLVGYR
jgi:hypothetical protein